MAESSKSLLFIMHDRPDYPGGPIINYLRLLPELVEAGYKVDLLSIYNNDYPNTRFLEEAGIAIHTHTYTHTPPLVSWILEKAEELQPDIFIPDVSTPGCLAGKWLIDSGIPVINTHRSDDELNWGKAIYFSSLQYNNVLTGILCVNTYLESALREKIGNSPILTSVIPSGVPIPLKMANQDQEGIKIVYAGRLVQRQKRVKEMFEEFVILCEKYQNITFTIIGDGPEKERCLDLIGQTPFASRFFFKGSLLGDQYKEELVKHQVIVLLSDYEGTPGSLMDGMSCGLIPVCLKYKGCEDLIKDNITGILVTDRKQSFQDAIHFLYSHPQNRLALSKNARNHIVENYSIEVTTKKWINFFEKCLLTIKKKEIFIAPQEIILPQSNSLLPEYIIQTFNQNIFVRALNRLRKLTGIHHER